jgi:hypothetical protein
LGTTTREKRATRSKVDNAVESAVWGMQSSAILREKKTTWQSNIKGKKNGNQLLSKYVTSSPTGA